MQALQAETAPDQRRRTGAAPRGEMVVTVELELGAARLSGENVSTGVGGELIGAARKVPSAYKSGRRTQSGLGCDTGHAVRWKRDKVDGRATAMGVEVQHGRIGQCRRQCQASVIT